VSFALRVTGAKLRDLLALRVDDLRRARDRHAELCERARDEVAQHKAGVRPLSKVPGVPGAREVDYGLGPMVAHRLEVDPTADVERHAGAVAWTVALLAELDWLASAIDPDETYTLSWQDLAAFGVTAADAQGAVGMVPIGSGRYV
jgi:hypothetical protein